MIYGPRPTVTGNIHAVSSGHYLATAAGYSILEAGGNAVDAGVCVGLALGVVHPHDVKIAGVAPIMIKMAGGDVVTIAGLGHWPRNMSADFFMKAHGGKMPRGILRTVVPAAPDAWITALRDYGTMTFGEVAAAAIEYASKGFPAYSHMLAHFTEEQEDYRKFEYTASVYLPNGRLPRPNERFVQTDLAATLQYMVDQEKASLGNGREAGLEAARGAFYKGDIADKIIRFHQENGGLLGREDLANFHSKYERPVSVRWKNHTVYTCGPWCQGPVLAQALKMLDRMGLNGLGHNSAEYIHVLVEVLKAAFADREYRYGDPDHVEVGIEEMLSDDYLDQRIAAIDLTKAAPDMPAPLGPLPNDHDWSKTKKSTPERGKTPEAKDTTYLCVIDKWGNALSATPSDGIEACPMVPGTGLVISPRGVQSRPDPTHPSGVGPGRRPRLTPNPAISVLDDGSIFTFGTPELDVQTQAMLQVFLNVFNFGMDIQEAIEMPRFATFSFPATSYPNDHLSNQVWIEDRLPQYVLDGLGQRGHETYKWPRFTRKASAVDAIFLDRTTNFIRAGADCREPSYAIAR
ncbi:gamma-glutamyltransferase family protein [Sinorhizobium meliloti]|uniref:gamma-glutamyltransferase family protein n=1 Tax=Rhizobium meliloti TaxID=382 RepID=UPI000380D046|nr:gamma-glutamyltransferase [Sinorhizobium meliloti]